MFEILLMAQVATGTCYYVNDVGQYVSLNDGLMCPQIVTEATPANSAASAYLSFLEFAISAAGGRDALESELSRSVDYGDIFFDTDLKDQAGDICRASLLSLPEAPADASNASWETDSQPMSNDPSISPPYTDLVQMTVSVSRWKANGFSEETPFFRGECAIVYQDDGSTIKLIGARALN